MLVLAPFTLIVVGVLLHALASHPTAKEIGRACFWTGFFWLGGWSRLAVQRIAHELGG